ncbi:MAG: 3-phosphoshikimate 1-carboxyvinyltransferase [Deltaproteobacteria bacterium]|nr:3-phosphoshikimate 1-carboxyvinyltransferase [Deltaproteobacteria bacterium]
MREIKPLQELDATVRIPGSKSYTQRAMVIAALADGESRLSDGLISEDTQALAAALVELGTELKFVGTTITLRGTGGRIARPAQAIHLGNNGTAIRLLTAFSSLGKGPVVLTGTPRLRERPLLPLITALASLGVELSTEGGRGYPPVTIRGGRLSGQELVLRDIESSQYVSALLIVAPFAEGDVTIVLQGRIPSLPYIALTLETMAAFGITVAADRPGRYLVPSGQRYQGRSYRIEGDVSSASYFFAAAALAKGRIRVENIAPQTRQGDIAFLGVLERLGCRILRGESHVEVRGGAMPAGEMVFEMGAMPDMVPTLSVLLACRPGRSEIRGVAHLRVKESDRLAALVAELRKTGIAAEELADGIVIEGGTPRGALIETYQDHRIAMSFAVLGLVSPGMQISDEQCVAKSFPDFWQALEGLY